MELQQLIASYKKAVGDRARQSVFLHILDDPYVSNVLKEQTAKDEEMFREKLGLLSRLDWSGPTIDNQTFRYDKYKYEKKRSR